MNSFWDSPLAVQVECHGLSWMFGPFPGLPKAVQFVSEHVWDTKSLPLSVRDPDEAAEQLNRRGHDDDRGLFDVPARGSSNRQGQAIRRDPRAINWSWTKSWRGRIQWPSRVKLKTQECWCPIQDMLGCLVVPPLGLHDHGRVPSRRASMAPRGSGRRSNSH